MVFVGNLISIIGIAGTALLVPMVFLLARGGGDPEGIVDGLLRLSWFMPLVWISGVALEVKGRAGRLRGMLQLHAPLVISLSLCAFFFFGWSNDGREIVLEPRPDSRMDALRRSRGEPAHVQGRIPVLGGLGKWAHETLPPHPFPKGGR